MGDKIELKVDKRTVSGKKVKTLRRDGLVPAVVYGADMKSQNIQAPLRDVEKVYKAAGSHSPIQLILGSKKMIAMLKEVNQHPFKGFIEHVSFHAVKATDPVTTEVPIHLTDIGESEAEKAGLVIMQAIEKVEIKALPNDLPDKIEISVKGLVTADDKLTVGDIVLPKGVELIDHQADSEDEDAQSVTGLAVVNVYAPVRLEAENEAAGGDSEATNLEEAETEDSAASEAEDSSTKE